jgi:hypothetical protein
MLWKRTGSSSNNTKKKKVKDHDAKLKKRAEQRLWSEAMRENRPMAIGTVAMIASSYCNQGACISFIYFICAVLCCVVERSLIILCNYILNLVASRPAWPDLTLPMVYLTT